MNPLIIIGAAPCISDDLASLPAGRSYDYMLIGLDSVDKFSGEAKYFATYHPQDIPKSIERRKEFGGNCDFKIISHEIKPGVDIVLPYQQHSGSSALLGVLSAIKFGYRRIILVGCPLIDVEGKKYANFQKGWQQYLDLYVGKVRSLSGWTKDFLGYPTEAWLDAVED